MLVKSGSARLRQYGRMLMGIAFILISLQFLREAMAPIRESAFLPALSGNLARDYLAAEIPLVLEANLGSALIPIWLTRGMSLTARQVARDKADRKYRRI